MFMAIFPIISGEAIQIILTVKYFLLRDEEHLFNDWFTSILLWIWVIGVKCCGGRLIDRTNIEYQYSGLWTERMILVILVQVFLIHRWYCLIASDLDWDKVDRDILLIFSKLFHDTDHTVFDIRCWQTRQTAPSKDDEMMTNHSTVFCLMIKLTNQRPGLLVTTVNNIIIVLQQHLLSRVSGVRMWWITPTWAAFNYTSLNS